MKQTTQQRKIKVLAIAEAANPEWVSVPLVGWSLVKALREEADVHLVTQIRNRQAILNTGLIEGKDFTAINSEAIMKPLWKIGSFLRGGKDKGWTTVGAINTLGYYYFEYLLWKRFKHSILSNQFDIIHRITPLSPATPSLLAKKCAHANTPFILGPLNGGVPWPKGFDNIRHQEKEWLSYIRSAYKLLPGYQSTLQSSAALLIGSKITLAQIPKRYHAKCVYLPENAIDPLKFSTKTKSTNNSQIKACFVGRLVPLKGLDMLLEAALPLLRNNKMKLEIIGDGPMMSSLRQFTIKEKITTQVTFHGWVEHSALQQLMCKSQIFTFPSIREFGGGVVLEAMALGLVPIVIDYAGPGELVTKKTGFKVLLGTRDEIINSLKSILTHLSSGTINIDNYADSARNRVNNLFTWPKKAKQVVKVYEWKLGISAKKPLLFNDHPTEKK